LGSSNCWRSGEPVPSQLPYDQARIKEVYMGHGYIDAQVAEPLMKIDYSNIKPM